MSDPDNTDLKEGLEVPASAEAEQAELEEIAEPNLSPSDVANLVRSFLSDQQCDEISGQAGPREARNLANKFLASLQSRRGTDMISLEPMPEDSYVPDVSGDTLRDKVIFAARRALDAWTGRPVDAVLLQSALEVGDDLEGMDLGPKHVAAAMMHLFTHRTCAEILATGTFAEAINVVVSNLRNTRGFIGQKDPHALDSPIAYLAESKIFPAKDESSVRRLVGKAIYEKVLFEFNFRAKLGSACEGQLNARQVRALRESNFMEPDGCPWDSQDGYAYFWAIQWLESMGVEDGKSFLEEKGVSAPTTD